MIRAPCYSQYYPESHSNRRSKLTQQEHGASLLAFSQPQKAERSSVHMTATVGREGAPTPFSSKLHELPDTHLCLQGQCETGTRQARVKHCRPAPLPFRAHLKERERRASPIPIRAHLPARGEARKVGRGQPHSSDLAGRATGALIGRTATGSWFPLSTSRGHTDGMWQTTASPIHQNPDGKIRRRAHARSLAFARFDRGGGSSEGHNIVAIVWRSAAISPIPRN